MAQAPSSTHVFDNWTKLIEAGDAKGLTALFSDDVVWSSPEGGVVSGKEAMWRYTAGTFSEAKASEGSFKVEHEQVSGDWATVTASFTASWKDRGGTTMIERSRYVCVLKRASNSEWKIWRFTYFPISERG